MKNDRNKMDLDQLLATLEHTGRDNRRQQELGAMIDSLAAAETTKHRGFWWWSSRVAAAACEIAVAAAAPATPHWNVITNKRSSATFRSELKIRKYSGVMELPSAL